MTQRKYLGLIKMSFSEVSCLLTVVLFIREDRLEMALQVFFLTGAQILPLSIMEAVLPNGLRMIKGLGGRATRIEVVALSCTSCLVFLNVSRFHFPPIN